MVTSFLALLLITFFFILVILVIIPAFLKWLAGRNIRIRHQVIRRLRTLDPQHELARDAILPYTASQSKRYRDLHSQAHVHLQEVTKIRQQFAEKINASEFPRVPDEGWPISYFLAYPQHMVKIPNASIILWQGNRLLNKAQKSLTQARQELDMLQEMPQSIQQYYEELVKERLPALQKQLAAERQAGITSLSDLETRAQQLVREAESLAQDLQGSVAAPSPNDQLALKLEGIEHKLQILTAEVEAIHKERLICDQKLIAVQQAFSEMPLQGQAEVAAPALVQLVTQINNLLQSAATARAQRNFQQANNITAVVEQLIPLTNLLDQMERVLRPLHQQQANSLQATAINEQYQAVQLIIQDVQTATNDFVTNPASSAGITALLTGYQEKAQKQQGQLKQLQKKLTTDHKQVAREADKARKEMEAAWRTLQKVIRLADDDEWHQAYLQRQQQFVFTKDKTVPLQQAINDAQALKTELISLRTNLAEDFEQLRDYLRQVPKLEKDAVVLAGQWTCLVPQVDDLREDLAVIQRRGQEALAADHINVAHTALDDVSAFSQHVQQIFAFLQEQGDQLDRIVDNISYALQLTIDDEGNVPPDLQHSKNSVDRLYQQAISAVTVDAALAALQQAETLAQQMTLNWQ